MEATARLDYVLFQLTPTRTRCDLVIFAGKLNEKLACGLLEPFIVHLRSAKDQISKGGYSITLRPPSIANASWFTKATLQRFVRFVSTPEVLERFVTIEREILQLEKSIKSYEESNAGGEADGGISKSAVLSYKSKYGSGESNDAAEEENSKVRLQRVLETRKSVLRREQAMVYARALAAGFEFDNLDDLLLFSDAFGASRLREACINFIDLCKMKNEDRLWVDEIAAMQASSQAALSYMGTSGIILAGEDNEHAQNFMVGSKQNGTTDVSLSDSLTSNGSSDINQDNSFPNSAQTLPTDGKGQMPMPWVKQFPQYPHNFQGVFGQMPPYQGYGVPGLQVPPYYPGNLQWPPNVKDPAFDQDIYERHNSKSSRKKERASYARGSESDEPSESSSDSDSSMERKQRKKHGKKSSRKVVIRNINYITSKRGENGSEAYDSDEDDYLNGNELQQVEDAVGSLEKHQKSASRRHRKRNGSQHGSVDQDDEDVTVKKNSGNKGNGNWDALQELLMGEESDSNGAQSHSVQFVEEEDFTSKQSKEQSPYSFELEAEGRRKQMPVSTDAFVVTTKETGIDGIAGKTPIEKFESGENFHQVSRRETAPEEFLFLQRTEETENFSRVTISDCAARSSVIKGQDSNDWFISKQPDEVPKHREDDLRFINGEYVRSSADHFEKKRKDVVIDDSLMIQGRFTDDHCDSDLRASISVAPDIVEASITENVRLEVSKKKPELSFHEPDDMFMMLDRETAAEQTVPSWTPELDYESNVSLNNSGKRNSEADAGEDSASVAKCKSNGATKKIGASATKATSKDARSRALAGAAGRNKHDTMSRNKKPTPGSRTTMHKTKMEQEEERRKRMEELQLQRQKRIAERSTAGGRSTVTSKKTPAVFKSTMPSIKAEKPKLKSSAEETDRMPKSSVFRSSTIERLAAAKTSTNLSTTQPKMSLPKKESPKVKASANKKVDQNKVLNSQKSAGSDIVNGVNSSTSVVKDENDTKDIKEVHVTSSVFDTHDGEPKTNHSPVLNLPDVSKEGIYNATMSLPGESESSDDHAKIVTNPTIQAALESPDKNLLSAGVVDKCTANANFTISQEISEIEESTPPPTEGTSPDGIHTRKKWESAENTPKASKGFRKLLMFGRKS